MNEATQRLFGAFDGHSDDGIRAAIADGADIRSAVGGRTPLSWLLEEYARTDRLAACIRRLLDAGAPFEHPHLLPVLLNDAQMIRAAVAADLGFLTRRTTLRCAFVSLNDATPLHFAAEYGHLAAVEALLDLGAAIDARAGADVFGRPGHTPLFHVVNSNANRSVPVMRLLLERGAAVDVCVAGLRWGEGYPWETVFFDVTPIAFAQMGLLPQVHRREDDIYANIRNLLDAAKRPLSTALNVPNRYLYSSSH